MSKQSCHRELRLLPNGGTLLNVKATHILSSEYRSWCLWSHKCIIAVHTLYQDNGCTSESITATGFKGLGNKLTYSLWAKSKRMHLSQTVCSLLQVRSVQKIEGGIFIEREHLID